MRRHVQSTGFAGTIFSLLLFICSMHSYLMAGAVPMPLEAHLDLAEYVVVGELTQMEDLEERTSVGVIWAKATITVEETLKGEPGKTVSCIVASEVTSKYFGSQHIQEYKKGDSGIWIITAGGYVDSSYGRFDIGNRDKIQQILKAISERRWSEEVNGLKAWAGVVGPEHGSYPAIIFAVKNVVQHDIYYPVETSNTVTAIAESQDKTVYRYPTDPFPHPSSNPYCGKLVPGKTVYLHPEYTCIDMKRKTKLPPGTYTVTVTYENDRDGTTSNDPDYHRIPVETWKGKLSAPAVTLVLPDEEKKTDKQ